MSNFGRAVFALVAALSTCVVQAAGDPERGRQIASDCAACHGPDGNSPSPAFPIIAGQHEEYLYASLLAYRDRGRDNAIMSATIIGKSDQDLQDLAAWFASQKGLGGGVGEGSGVADAATATGALLAEGDTDVLAAVTALPDESLCADGDPNVDSDNDGLADAYDAAPNDAAEFVLDTNDDGRYEICSIQQLQAIITLGTTPGSATTLSETERMARGYELVRNVDAAGLDNFIPIGNCGPTGNCMKALDEFGFKGSFDGRGHTISNLTIDAPDVGGVGLFGVISRGKIVRNIELQNAQINGRAGTGTIVGSNFGTVYNCHSTGSVKGFAAIGGLVGANAGNISYSHASVDVEGQMATGGLVGDQNSSVFASYATGRVRGGDGTGGLVGLNTRGRVVSSYAIGDVSGGENVGGLVGLNTDALLVNSYATGDVTGTKINAGGVVGFNSKSRLRNAYASGNVQGVSGVGGIAGNNSGIIFQSYAVGRVSGESDVGGITGKNGENGIIENSYWDTQSTGQAVASGTEEGEVSDAIGVDRKDLQALDGDASGWAPSNAPDGEPEFWFCDLDGSGVVEEAEQVDGNYAWDMGLSTQSPALRCAPGGANRQRI